MSSSNLCLLGKLMLGVLILMESPSKSSPMNKAAAMCACAVEKRLAKNAVVVIEASN